MTSTEIAVRQNGHVAVTERDVVDGWITVVGDVAKLSDHIAETDFVPKALRNKPAAIAACILTGRELGIGPMASLKSIHMVQGVPSLSAEYKRARALAAGHQIVVDESNATRCVVRGRRAGAENWLTIQWTLDMAKRAKISGKEVWQAYPQRMLQARATSELCDLLFPDATLGLPTTEELEDGGALAVAAEVAIEAAAETAEPPKPAQRTAQRRQRAQAPAAEDDTRSQPGRPAGTTDGGQDRSTGESPARNAVPRAAGAAPARGAQPPPPQDPALPPLPGEEEAPDPTAAPTSDASATPATSNGGSGEPPAQPPSDPDAHGTATRGKGGQLTALWTVLNTVFNFADQERDQARGICEHIIGRDLPGTTGDMSWNEARTVLDTLANWQKIAESRGREPRETLISILAESGRAGDDSA